MTFYNYGNFQKVERQNVEYVKVRFFAHPLIIVIIIINEVTNTTELSKISNHEHMYEYDGGKRT